MAQVTYQNMFSEARNNVVALMTTVNVPDNSISSSEYRKRIYSREPDVKSNNFSGYPYIIINPSNVDIEKEGGSGDGKHKFVNFDIDIEIRTSDRGYGKNEGQGLSDMDSYSNNIIKTFMDITNRSSLSQNYLEFIEPSTGNVDIIKVNNELIYRRIILLSFRSRMVISL